MVRDVIKKKFHDFNIVEFKIRLAYVDFLFKYLTKHFKLH